MKRARSRVSRVCVLSLGALLLLGLSGAASATPLGLALEPSPDIFVGFGSTTYSAGGQSLTLDGQPQSYFLASSACDPACAVTAALGDFSLTASVDNSGNLVGTGSLTIDGSVGTLGYGSPLLTGTVTAFGFDAGTPALPFEFLFTVTGGSAASDFGGAGATGGIIWGHNSTFSGSFGSDFSASFTSNGDVAPTPEPSAALLLLSGALGFAVWRARRV